MKLRNLTIMAVTGLIACDERPATPIHDSMVDSSPRDLAQNDTLADQRNQPPDACVVPKGYCVPGGNDCPKGFECLGCYACEGCAHHCCPDCEKLVPCPVCSECLGKCVPESGCLDNTACKPDDFCFLGQGCGKGEPGICQDRPEICDDIDQPVCGCDGQTYGNECEAQAAGINTAHPGECGMPPCTTDADCTQGKQWCEQGICVACDNSGLLCDLACPFQWDFIERNGCYPCACAPSNECTADAQCSGGQKCYAGQYCWSWCPPGDPSCCLGNICSPAGCTTPNPVGCKVRGCPHGESCQETGCESSVCSCSNGSWGCLPDCGGGTCVSDKTELIEYANCAVVDCQPLCSAVGTKSEGWYHDQSCGSDLIGWDSCAGCTAICLYVGSYSEGWYTSCP